MHEAMRLVLQALIDLEATEKIGAARYERTVDRTKGRRTLGRSACATDEFPTGVASKPI